jgi:hypothetical protein
MYTATWIMSSNFGRDRAFEVTEQGAVVGTQNFGNLTSRGFIWREGTTNILNAYSITEALCGSDVLVGGMARIPSGADRSAVWEAGAYRDPGYPISRLGTSRISAMSSDGGIAGYSQRELGSEAFVLKNGEVTSILARPHRFLRVTGLNQSNDLVGTEVFGELQTVFHWSPTKGLSFYGIGSALDISDNGDAVGYLGTQGGLSAFLLHDGELVTLKGYAAHAINSAGVIVGNRRDSDIHAVMWLNREMVDIDPLVVTEGWAFRTAVDISDTGHILAAGSFNGESGYALLTPVPEVNPASVLVFGILVLRILVWRTHCR